MYSNSSAQNKTASKDIYRNIGELMGYYIIPGLFLVGVITNAIFASTILKLKKRDRFYNILLAKQIIDTLTFMFGVGYQNFHCTFCDDQVYNTYFFHFYRIYLMRYPVSILFFASVTFEVLICLERYKRVYSKKNFTEKIPVKMITSIIILVSIVLFIPDYLAIEILPTDKEDTYVHTFTNIGKTQWYSAYYLVLFLAFYIGSIATSIYLNLYIVKGLKHFVQKKLALIGPLQKNFLKKKRIVNHQKTVTIIIIATTTTNIAFRLFHFVTLVIFKVHVLNGVNYLPSTNLMRAFSYFFLNFINSLSLFIYLSFDQNIRQALRKSTI